MILSTSTEKKKFDVKATDTFLYGLAPLPYATGLFPRALHDEVSIEFLPPVEEAERLSFSEQNKRDLSWECQKESTISSAWEALPISSVRHFPR